MTSDQFNELMEAQFEECRQTLSSKSEEYASDYDRLHNFKVAAALKGETPIEALSGMMAKHTVSVYDLCHGRSVESKALWDEKIKDHINYLILLKALVVDKDSDETYLNREYFVP